PVQPTQDRLVDVAYQRLMQQLFHLTVCRQAVEELAVGDSESRRSICLGHVWLHRLRKLSAHVDLVSPSATRDRLVPAISRPISIRLRAPGDFPPITTGWPYCTATSICLSNGSSQKMSWPTASFRSSI